MARGWSTGDRVEDEAREAKTGQVTQGLGDELKSLDHIRSHVV
jgi:hypothetical protein